ncbi:hypothetical protein ALQ37_200212 [Pseudomonas syringae pv. aptata]|uniref:Uncharacterized protein n=1 Tax=Pseudomonas syringae pv. aptata TaxID=83167 RepID=A0A0Q0FBY1_PSEAP|nr:DUF805 domain-containing protein [Pseudomonas syringae]KPY97926.1 putative Membrane protein [Pseudomonas syringae pv. aptata]RMO65462.1 hypothetical protein ALQ37_200212 [Pseudomonas syringae pv. aptata]
MKRLATFLLFLSMILSGSAFAATDPFANCGLTPDGKKIDVWNSGVCPQNITQRIHYNFLGVGAFGKYETQNLITTGDDIDSTLSEGQKNLNASNQNLMQLIIMFSYGIALFICIFLSAPYAFAYVKAMINGEFHQRGNEQTRYHGYGLLSIFATAAGVLAFMPGLMGVKGSLSFGGYAGSSAGNMGLLGENFIIGSFLNHLEDGGLEVKTDNGTLKDYREKQQTSQTYYSSQATVAGFISTSLVIANTSAFNNAIENLKSNDKSWKIRDKTADVWQPNDKDGIDFIKKFSEDPNQTMWSTDSITFAQNPTEISETLPYFKAINYNKSYRDFSDIEGLVNQAAKLASDIQTSSFSDSPSGFDQIKQSAVAYFYEDAQANILRKNFLQWMEKSDAIADLINNYACSKNYSARIAAQNFIDAHSEKPTHSGGNTSCVSNDWKVMGEGKTEDYVTQINEKTKALIDEYYDVRIKINTAMNTSFQSDTLHKKIVEIYQKGFLHFVFFLPQLMDDLNFSSTVQNEFQNSTPMMTIQTQAMGSYIVDDWSIAHGYGDANGVDLQIGEAVRELNLIPNSTGSSSLKDGSAILQKLYSTQATASAQQRDYDQAVGTGLNNPKVELTACLNTTTYPVTCMQKYGQKVSETMTDIMYIAATVKLVSVITTHYGDKKKDKVMSEQAKEDEKAGISKKQTAKNGKKINSKPNFLQIVGAVTNGLASAAFGWALFGYLFSTALKFASIVLMTTPFAVLYILNILYFLIMIATMPLAIISFYRMNDMNNLRNIGRTLFNIFLSLVAFGPIIVSMYLLNYQMTAVFQKIIIPAATNGLGVAFASGSMQIFQSALEAAVALICFMVVGYTCTRYAFKILTEALEIFELNMPFLEHGEAFLGRVGAIQTVASGGIFRLLNIAIANKVDNVAFSAMRKIFRRKKR